MDSGAALWLLLAAMAIQQLRASPVSEFIFGHPDENPVHSPCEDAKVRRYDGFSFGLVFSTKESFFFEDVELSPCDTRLGFAGKPAVQVTVFRPFVDEISFLTINTSTFHSVQSERHMVAFAGRKYAARSLPTFVGNSSFIVTSFTLVFEFQQGTLQNLYWKSDGCTPCSKESSNFVCINNQVCAIQTSQCASHNGPMDCDINIQLAFSGTDKNYVVLNSWYEVSKLRQYSLYKLFSDLRNSLTSPFDVFFK